MSATIRQASGTIGDASATSGKRPRITDQLLRNAISVQPDADQRASCTLISAGRLCARFGGPSAKVTYADVQRSVKVSSMTTSTATGSPCRMPGRKRHCRAAFIASRSRPNDRIERAHHLHLADRAVRPDDALEEDRALHLRAHRVGGVLRLHLAKDDRSRHAIARPIGSAAGSAAASRSETRAGAWTDSGPGPVPAPPPDPLP